MKSFLARNWFLPGLIAALLFGYFFSEAGLLLNPGNRTGTVILVVIFLFLGMTIRTDAIVEGVRQYRLHIFIQLFIFIFCPLFIFSTSFILRSVLDKQLFVGLFALSCLPTTASSCIVFTRLAGGNAAGSMINSALSNILGVFISPLILSFLLQSTGGALQSQELFRVFISLGLKMFAPLIAGQIMRRFFTGWIDRNGGWWKNGINILILATIFFAFSRASSSPLFREQFRRLIAMFGYLAAVHIALAAAGYFGSGLIGLSREDRIAALFTGSQKTIVLGVPLVTSFFTGSPELLGVAILPLAFYHPYQLIVAGIIRSLFFRKGTSL